MNSTGSAGSIPSSNALDVVKRYDAARPKADVAAAPARTNGTAARVSISREATQFSELKSYVRQLLEDQGVELNGEYWDGLSVEDAQAAIADGGEWSAEAVADRILDFVGNISDGNPEMKARLQDAVRQGFDEARQALGGTLPEVSQRTYDLVFERFDDAFQRNDDAAAG